MDRKKDVIVSGGENIYPVQIESFLSSYEKVKDVAVIGLPDKRLGEITGAIIAVKDGMECTEQEIMDYCMALPRYQASQKDYFCGCAQKCHRKDRKARSAEKVRG